MDASETRYRALLGDAQTVAVITDADGIVSFVTENVERELGVTAASLLGVDAFQHMHRDEVAEARARLREHLHNPAIAMQQVRELRLQHADGRWLWFEVQSGNRLDVPGIGGIVHYLRSIDARKQAEAAARDSESRYRSVVEMLPGYVHETLLDADGEWRLVWCSPGFTHMFGVDRDAFVASGGWDARVHPDDLPAVQARRAPLRAGQSIEGEFRIMTPRGWRWVHALNRPRHDPESLEVTGAIGLGLDITERKLLERELIEVANREQERIGHDLHDGLGQDLTGIALLLRGLAGRVRKELPEAVAELDDIVRLVNEATQNARLLARGLSPLVVERGGLGGALQVLGGRARELYGLEARVELRGEAGVRVDRSTAMHLYRIAQEAVTNVARHAEASRLRITLGDDARKLQLVIADNGRGLPADREHAGLGLRIMGYRAAMIGGELAVGPGRRGGTVVRVTCPATGSG